VRIYGTGIDLIEVCAFATLLDRGGDDFARRCFSAEELAVAGSGKLRAARLAGCFAAKESVLKALGTGWTGGIALNEVVINAASTPTPMVTLTGRALVVARESGVTSWLISISLAGGMALASAVACSD
jgi:holo-[acyl-carrier protein] synthase